MEYLNSNTKKARDFIKRYNASTIGDIYEAYKTPSPYKVNAYNNILTRDFNRETESKDKPQKHILDYWGYKIIGANCSYFTLARLMAVINKDTGEICNMWLVVDTPTKEYRIHLNKGDIK